MHDCPICGNENVCANCQIYLDSDKEIEFVNDMLDTLHIESDDVLDIYDN